jgi:TonB dependent receptor-like, beta-barrel/Carboxypeptidase regulatory-like domain
MTNQRRRALATWIGPLLGLVVSGAAILIPGVALAQGLTGALIGTVRDADGGVLPGATVRVSSPALIGGPRTLTTNENGQLRFPTLPPGLYVLDIELAGFASFHEADIPIGAGATIERTVPLRVAGVVDSVVVVGTGSRIDARNSGFGTRVGPEDLTAIPVRRLSVYDWVKTAPGISPTSPAGASMLVSAFGSGVDQNQFFIDGMNVSAPTNGVGRSDPSVDFVQELQIQSVGVSAEYGNVQGAVVNIITRSGSNRFLYEASYYAQTAGLTSQPVRREYDRVNQRQSGFERARYRDFTTTLGGPAVRDRLWFFSGYQYLRDDDSQPGTDPTYPRTYEQDKILAKLTWRLAPAWQLVQSFHEEFTFNPEVPTSNKPLVATQFVKGSVPATNFGHLTHAPAGNTVWDVRLSRYSSLSETSPPSGDRTIPNRVDQPGNLWSQAPQTIGEVKHSRATGKVTVSHYGPRLVGADHEWKMGAQVDRGEHRGHMVIPSGERRVYRNGVLEQRTLQDPTHSGGEFVTSGAFVSDTLRVGSRVTINAGLRFDHTRAISQDMHRLDANGDDTGEMIDGRGTMGTWNMVSPRLGVIAKLDAAGQTLLRGSYGRFGQGTLTGEVSFFHPGQTIIRMIAEPEGVTTTTNPAELQFDSDLRVPYTDQYSIGVDREIGGRLAVSAVYVRKDGRNFIGWIDVGGQYREEPVVLPDGRTVQVFTLTNLRSDRRYRLTNPADYSLTYNGLVVAVEKRRSHGWQAFGSYTLSRAYGLQPSSGTTAAGAQVATVGSPPGLFAAPVTFGRDPNDLTNAEGRLPNDRPHIFRVMTAVDIPGTGFVVAANLQHYSGKPWAATALINPQDTQRRVLLEPRGSQRLPAQTLLDFRVSRAFGLGSVGQVELRLDVLNLLNDTAGESVETDVFFDAAFGRANIFMDPRRAMVSVKLNLGR